MFTARLQRMKLNDDGSTSGLMEQVIECEEYIFTDIPSEGLLLEMMRPGGASLVVYAQNHDAIYIENATGKTVDMVKMKMPADGTEDIIIWRKGYGTITLSKTQNKPIPPDNMLISENDEHPERHGQAA